MVSLVLSTKGKAAQCREAVRKAASCVDSQFSRDRVRLDRVEHPAPVHLLVVAGVRANNAEDRIPPARHAVVSDKGQEWAAPQACLLRECRAVSRLVGQARLHADQDSVISTGRKKAR